MFCLDNSIVEASACAVGPDDSCTFCELVCTDADGNTVLDECTEYFITCDEGLRKGPYPVPPSKQCYMGEIVNPDKCPSRPTPCINCPTGPTGPT